MRGRTLLTLVAGLGLFFAFDSVSTSGAPPCGTFLLPVATAADAGLIRVDKPKNAPGHDEDGDAASTYVEKPTNCARGDHPETGVDGQIPMPDRLMGFKGFNCNLKMIGSVHARPPRGDGIWQQFAMLYHDRAGHRCGYEGGTNFTKNPGTVVVDLTDPYHPVQTAVLTTPGMMTPGEGLRVNQRRGLLASASYQSIANPDMVSHGFDVYDVETDCRHPRLLVTTSLTFDTSGLAPYAGKGPWPNPDRVYGHEGAFAPDGMTYWISDVPHMAYFAVDLSDPRHPKLIGTYQDPLFTRSLTKGVGLVSPIIAYGVHGLSISDDGDTAYFAAFAYDTATDSGATIPSMHNGFSIVDVSQIQARTANPRVRMLGRGYWSDGSAEQMTIPANINGRQYLITTEEGGTGQLSARGDKAACAEGRTPFGMPRIHDIANESSPREVAKIELEVDNPANCALFGPEIHALNGFIYDVHMCSVDDRDHATTLACSYFQSGIRVFDIRDPKHVKEIAYFVPPAESPGPGNPSTGQGPGWCGAIPFLDASKGMLYSTCDDTGVFALKFESHVWPFPDSKTPPDRQL